MTTLKPDTLKAYRNTLKPIALVLIVSLVFLYALSIRTFQAIDSMWLDGLIILYGIGCMTTAIFRYIGIAYGGLFRGIADYFRHKDRLVLESMSMMVMLDGLGLLGLSGLLLLHDASILTAYGNLVFVLALLNAIASGIVFILYKKVAHALALYAIDEGNRKQLLESS